MRGLLVILGVIVVLFHVTGGWYFSGRIEHDALSVRAVPLVLTVPVAALATDAPSMITPALAAITSPPRLIQATLNPSLGLLLPDAKSIIN